MVALASGKPVAAEEATAAYEGVPDCLLPTLERVACEGDTAGSFALFSLSGSALLCGTVFAAAAFSALLAFLDFLAVEVVAAPKKQSERDHCQQETDALL